MKEFKDRVAVVTGGASGIGRALIERFAAEGIHVVIADVEETSLRQAEDELKAKGASVLGVVTDVSKAESVENLAHKTVEAFGAVHILCNNAGVSGDLTPSWEQTLQNWEWVFGVNVYGVVHGLRTFVPIMLNQGTEGHIVNTASMAGIMSGPYFSVYHASKHAVVTLTESLHYELSLQKAKIKASVLCPGWVNTKIVDSARNRPDELKTPDQAPSEIGKVWFNAFKEFAAGGMEPSQVAERVFSCIRDEQFYVFPHPEFLEAARGRMENLVAQQNPTLAMPDEMKERLKVE